MISSVPNAVRYEGAEVAESAAVASRLEAYSQSYDTCAKEESSDSAKGVTDDLFVPPPRLIIPNRDCQTRHSTNLFDDEREEWEKDIDTLSMRNGDRAQQGQQEPSTTTMFERWNLRSVFDDADMKQAGTIDSFEIVDAFSKMGVPISPKEAGGMSRGRSINFHEFVTLSKLAEQQTHLLATAALPPAMSSSLDPLRVRQNTVLKTIFNKIAADEDAWVIGADEDDAWVSQEKLTAAIKGLGAGVEEVDAAQLIQELDSTNTGKLNFDDFAKVADGSLALSQLLVLEEGCDEDEPGRNTVNVHRMQSVLHKLERTPWLLKRNSSGDEERLNSSTKSPLRRFASSTSSSLDSYFGAMSPVRESTGTDALKIWVHAAQEHIRTKKAAMKYLDAALQDAADDLQVSSLANGQDMGLLQTEIRNLLKAAEDTEPMVTELLLSVADEYVCYLASLRYMYFSCLNSS